MDTDLEKIKNYSVLKGPVSVHDIKVLHGANYFSGGPVIRFRIDLGKFDEVFTNAIDGFYGKLKELVPSLYEHHCSPGVPGGFFQRVEEGTLLGHVIEHTAIELQTLAGMDVGFGKTRMTQKQGVYNVVFRFMDPVAGIYAGKAAVNLINSILNGKSFNVKLIIENLTRVREKRLLGFSTQAIVDEADNRGIPAIRLNKYNLVQLGTGKYRKLIRATITGNTSLIAVETADNKYRTTQILSELGVPVPDRTYSENPEDILDFWKKLKKPVVIKPGIGYQGKRVSINLNDKDKILSAFEFAHVFDEGVIVQEYIPGSVFRILVIDNKYVATAQVSPATIVGDGVKTIEELINDLNANPERESGDKGRLSLLEIDEDVLKILELLELNLKSVPESGQTIYLRNSGNLRMGGQSSDMTDEVHLFNRFLCERISRIMNFDVVGIDLISQDISKPLTENGGKVIEINAAPDFKYHLKPYEGLPRLVQKNFIDMLFPDEFPTRIPVFSVSGSKGKCLTVTILNKCLKANGFTSGVVSRNGLYVSDYCLKEGDVTDMKSVELILTDPTIDCAIIETPVETILNSGLGYKFADVGIILNLYENKEDYYNYDHIFDIEDIAYAKAVVAEEVYEKGFSILNADDPMILNMISRLYSIPVLFSENYENVPLREIVEAGGIGVVTDDSKIVVLHGTDRKEIAFINEIPILTEQPEKFVLQSVLAATAALYSYGISVEEIRNALSEAIGVD